MKNWHYIKRLVVLLLICGVICTLCGCVNECLSVEYETVDVKIVDEYYRGPWTQMVMSGKVLVPVHHAAVYRISVQYDGKWYDVGGMDIYNQYKDRIGETVTATMEIRTFTDDTVKRNIISLGSVEATE